MSAIDIVWIVVDQWRADYFGHAGAGFARTPNIDALAGRATVYRNHYTAASPCGPSRASMLTGLYAMLHRSTANGVPLAADLPTFPTEARRAGYRPRLFGYTDTTPDPRGLAADDPRLTTYEGVMPGFIPALVQNHDDPGPWLGHLERLGIRPIGDRPAGIWDRELTGDAPFSRAPARYPASHSDTHYLTDRVLGAWAADEGPRCDHVTYLRPHPPLQAPAPYHALIDAGSVPDPLPEPDWTHPFLSAFRDWQRRSRRYDPEMDLGRMRIEDVRAARAVYLGLCAEVDHHIGRMIDDLIDSGRFDNTLIILTADHGELLGDYGVWGKTHWFEACWRVPLIIKWPGQISAAEVTALTESVDLLPTILDVLQTPVPPDCNGRSLQGLEVAVPPDWRTVVMSELDLANPLDPLLETALGVPSSDCQMVLLTDAVETCVVMPGLPSLLLATGPHGQHPIDDPGRLAGWQERLLHHRIRHQTRAFPAGRVTPDGWRPPQGPRE